MNRGKRGILSLILVMGLIMAVTSCRSPKQALKVPIKEEGADFLIKKLKENEFGFADLSVRFSATYFEDQGRRTTLSGQIRMQHDSVIWISVSPALGIEIFRILVSQDSIFLLNRFEKSYLKENFSFVNRFINSSLDFDMLQALLLGNDFSMYESAHFKASMDNGSYKLSTSHRRRLKKAIASGQAEHVIPVQDIWLDPTTYKISKVMIREAEPKGRRVQAEYANIVEVLGQKLPSKISLTTEGDKKITLEIEYTKITLNEGIDFPFKVPDSYQEMH